MGGDIWFTRVNGKYGPMIQQHLVGLLELVWREGFKHPVPFKAKGEDISVCPCRAEVRGKSDRQDWDFLGTLAWSNRFADVPEESDALRI